MSMMDRGRARDLNEAARRFAETLVDSYRLVYGQAAESAERQQQRAQEFSELVSSNLREQTEARRSNAQQLSEQTARQQEAGQALARESVEAYAEFLDTAFSQYREGAQRVATGAQEQARVGSQAFSDMVDIAANTTRDTADIAAGRPPFSDYDAMNVDEITEQLDSLSEAELRRTRNYEQGNKNRETLITQMDRRLEASS
jgi:hypothetical protein